MKNTNSILGKVSAYKYTIYPCINPSIHPTRHVKTCSPVVVVCSRLNVQTPLPERCHKTTDYRRPTNDPPTIQMFGKAFKTLIKYSVHNKSTQLGNCHCKANACLSAPPNPNPIPLRRRRRLLSNFAYNNNNYSNDYG